MIYVNLVLLCVIGLLLVYIAYKKNNTEMFSLDMRDYADCSGDKLSADHHDYMLDTDALVSHAPLMPYEATCKVNSRPGNH